MDLVEELLGGEFDSTLAAIPVQPNRDRANYVRGMLLGVGLGDVLGGPHEFRNQVPLSEYTGVLEFPLTLFRRFQGGKRIGSIGQITDDSEMTIALATSIVASGLVYSRERAVRGYLAWANSGCYFLGNNTRALFQGVKTVAGYDRRMAAMMDAPIHMWSQSNGCLMRCSPLATLADEGWLNAAITDCALTNPHPVCVLSVAAYIATLRQLLAGRAPTVATTTGLDSVRDLAADKLTGDAATIADARRVVSGVIDDARQLGRRDVTEQKGHIIHALHCAYYAINLPHDTFAERIDQVVRMGGDTDTNGAIAGALLGAVFGERRMRGEIATGRNCEVMLAVDPTAGELGRPRQYGAQQLLEMADALL